MLKFLFHFNLIIIMLCFTSCGGNNKSSTKNDEPLTIDGTFIGKDSANRDATVVVNKDENTINVTLRAGSTQVEFAGDIILTSIASSGKKMATGDISYNVDLKITSSTVDGFAVNEVSYGKIIKSKDNDGVWQYACTFNFTGNANRGTEEVSDWSMSGVAQ